MNADEMNKTERNEEGMEVEEQVGGADVAVLAAMIILLRKQLLGQGPWKNYRKTLEKTPVPPEQQRLIEAEEEKARPGDVKGALIVFLTFYIN